MLDTNFLIRLNQFQPEIGKPGSVLQTLSQRFNLCICLQNLSEFWSVATRPFSANGLGMVPAETKHRVVHFLESFQYVNEQQNTVSLWLSLCELHKISGKRVHDAKLVATALADGITTVVTSNTADFRCFSDITLINPFGFDSEKVNEPTASYAIGKII